jgi:hypothetical protein
MNVLFVSARRLRRFLSVVAIFAAAIAHSASVTTIATGLSGPIGMTLDSAGDLIVADLELDAVVKISRSGIASVIGHVNGAYVPRYDAGGNLYVTSFTDGELVRFDPNGATSTVVIGLSNPAGFWIEPAGTIVLAQSSGTIGIVRIDLANGITPLGISGGYEAIFDPAGRLLISRFGSGTVTRYALPSTVGATVTSGMPQVGGLAFDATGDLYVAVQSTGKIVRIPSSGPAVDFVTGLHSPRGLVFDSAGGLFVSNRLDGTIQRIGTDTTAPVVSVPGTITVAATGPAGATVTFSASALDDVPGFFSVMLSHASGSTFPIGTTTVTASATDPAGNTGSAAFQVIVNDTIGPVITASSPPPVEATGPSGAIVTFAASAVDAVSGPVTVQATPASASTFAVGLSSVSLSATDASGNTANKTILVSVVDTTPPSVTVPADIIAEATSAGGAIVTFSTSAMDIVSGSVSTSASPASGSTFPLGASTVNVTAGDTRGNSASGSFTVTVRDTTPPNVTLNGAAVVVVACHTAFVDPGATAIDSCAGSRPVIASGSVNSDAVGSYSITYTASDPSGNIGVATRVVQVVNALPTFVSVTGPAGPLALGNMATVTIEFADADTTQPHRLTINWDDGSVETLNVAAGLTSVTTTHIYGSTGVNTLRLALDDGCAIATTVHEFIVIYDPNGGFVTGGGWINSPAGAVTGNPSVTGRATFGFVSKYLPGTNVPSGNTEFQFQAAGIRFKSTSYDWLVVAGARAQYKGSGTFNNISDCQFLLTATDGDAPGGGGVDKFRLKITKDGGVLYDNNPGGSDDLDNANPQAVGGGSIQIKK